MTRYYVPKLQKNLLSISLCDVQFAQQECWAFLHLHGFFGYSSICNTQLNQGVPNVKKTQVVSMSIDLCKHYLQKLCSKQIVFTQYFFYPITCLLSPSSTNRISQCLGSHVDMVSYKKPFPHLSSIMKVPHHLFAQLTLINEHRNHLVSWLGVPLQRLEVFQVLKTLGQAA